MPEDKGKEPPSEARLATKSGFAHASRKAAPPAVAALRMEPLVVWVIQRVDNFPRKSRFTIGDRWIDTCLDIQTSLVEASYVREKRALLLSASRGLVRARVVARVATTLHALSLDQEAHFDRETTELGRMIGGWLRSLASKRPQDVGAEARP
jgi:hypothetical protein